MIDATMTDVETIDVAAQSEDSDDGDRDYVGTATYSLHDNKLRLYPFARLDRATYDRVKAAGFSWAPKQEVFVAGMWTPGREDLLVELCGDIEEEDITPEERAEQRSERFAEYSGNASRRAAQADRAVRSIADHIPFGQPILLGHHSERRARKDAERIQQGMRRLVDEMKRTSYWSDRAADVLHHAKYLEKPAVRARRIKTIEADLRKSQRSKAEAEKFIAMWTNPEKELTHQRAMAIANYDHVYRKFPLADYPRELPASQYEGDMSLHSALEDHIITPEQAREIAVRCHRGTIAWRDRWIQHYENRLAFERAMLGEDGGIATDRVKPEVGGAIRSWAGPGYGKGWSYIRKVNKVSVTVDDVASYCRPGSDKPKIFKRTMPFDKVTAIMSKAQVEEARAAGPEVFVETAYGDGFFLSTDPLPKYKKIEEPAWKAIEEAANNVQVVSAPELFPTPPALAARMVEEAGVSIEHRILEPSAGSGAILDAINDAIAEEIDRRPARDFVGIVSIEINPAVCNSLRGRYPAVRQGDFLECTYAEIGAFDRILMNPPFSAEVEHVRHAFKFLRDGGRLVAIMSEGPFYRSYKADAEFRAWLKDVGGVSEQLPPDTFKESGTGVNTRLVTISK